MMQMIIPAGCKHIVCTECDKTITDNIVVLNEGKMVCFRCWISTPHDDFNWDDQICLIEEK